MGLSVMLAVLLGPAAGPVPRARVCLMVRSRPARWDLGELAAALRARIAWQQLAVVPCGAGTAPSAWRVVVEQTEPGAARLSISGEGMRVTRVVRIGPQAGQQTLIATVALAAAEILRPTIDSLRSAKSVAPAKSDDVARRQRDRSRGVVAPVPDAAGWVALSVGPQVTLAPFEPKPAIDLEGRVPLGPWSVGLSVFASTIGRNSAADVGLRGWELRVGLGPRRRFGRLELGVRLAAQLSWVRLSGADPAVPRQWQSFWTAGAAIEARYSFWRWKYADLGLASQVWVWPRPDRFLVAGVTALERSYVDAFVGASLLLTRPVAR